MALNTKFKTFPLLNNELFMGKIKIIELSKTERLKLEFGLR